MPISWIELEQTLTESLHLTRPPVGIALVDTVPHGVRRFLGQAPSGCSFWTIAQSAAAGRSAFYTLPRDHFGCPVGSYTHNLEMDATAQKELEDTLALMVEIGYLRREEVPGIPRWPSHPTAIVYARLGDMPVAPDAVIVAARAAAAMLLGEASRAAGRSSGLPALPRPTCMAIPAASAQGTTLSLGCIGNRVYTDLDDGEIYAFLRGADVSAVAEALAASVRANQQLTAYHRERKPRLTQADAGA